MLRFVRALRCVHCHAEQNRHNAARKWGREMGENGIAVIVGVLVGILAGLPVWLLVLALLARKR